MRLMLHDWSGHAFTAQLARWLAQSGHTVTYANCATFLSPHGELHRRVDDPPGVSFVSVDLGEEIDKYHYIRRRRQEQRYGRLLADLVKQQHADVVLLCNTPLDAAQPVVKAAREAGIPHINWVQDIYSEAIRRYAQWPLVGSLVSAHYRRLEGQLLREADAVVAITSDFVPLFAQWGVPEERVVVQPNWAPLDDTPVMPKKNAWSQAHGLADRFVFLYAGTLGLKHDPSLLLELARRLQDPDSVVVVVSEGLGADWLRANASSSDPILVVPYVDFGALPEVLASGDVLLALLEPAASVFSVPSKVLSYFCAARPILAAMPLENLAARAVVEAGAGCAVPPDRRADFVEQAAALTRSADQRRILGCRGRAYAEAHFRREVVQPTFDKLLHDIA